MGLESLIVGLMRFFAYGESARRTHEYFATCLETFTKLFCAVWFIASHYMLLLMVEEPNSLSDFHELHLGFPFYVKKNGFCGAFDGVLGKVGGR